MGRDAVHHRSHRVLADAVMQVAALPVLRREGGERLLEAGRSLEVGGAAEELGQGLREIGQDLGRDLDRRTCLPGLGEAALGRAKGVLPILRQARLRPARECGPLLGIPRGQALRPVRIGGPVAPARPRPPGAQDVVRHREGRVVPAPRRAGLGEIGREDAPAMGAALALEPRQAAADHRGTGDQARPRILLRARDRVRDGLDIVPVRVEHLPVGGAKAGPDILRDRQVGAPVIGDAVVVPQEDQLAEAQVAGERDHLVGDALHQAAVAHEGVAVVVDEIPPELGGELRLGHRHADRVGDALPEGPGGRLDAEMGGDLRVPVAMRAELAEAPDLLDREALVAREVKRGVEQHRAVAVREHEAVPVGPFGVRGVAFEVAGEQRGGDLGAAEGGAGMPVARPLDGVEGEEADRVRHPVARRGGGAGIRLGSWHRGSRGAEGGGSDMRRRGRTRGASGSVRRRFGLDGVQRKPMENQGTRMMTARPIRSAAM
ncbi:hypothetical protein AEGHOMDF_0083 [Methylobacterium soli]|nr:hypothetical protein AEGHOMDF_0083 [Methylobacterium soli]